MSVAGPIAAQNSAPVLIDRFDRISCSDIRARLDSYIDELSNDKYSSGVVVLSGDADFTRALERRGLIENQFKLRNFDRGRIRFIRKRGLPELGVELWKTLGLTDLSFDYDSKWSYYIPKGTKPFVVYFGGYNESECNFPSGADILMDFLRANINSRGNVVVRCNGNRCFNQIKTLVSDELKENGVPLSRVRFYYVPIRSQYFETEFWLLP